ncbi:MAG: response regulator [Candidatus Tectomicrobia bacterium]|uniref:histidine kinase n=1 Tax=Tectimicrobiota bacterium TaxID=2528274 RepID=A0A932GPB0_UNCTE|nr:response regulator [Candidatus Tectomicrobia bacterium]
MKENGSAGKVPAKKVLYIEDNRDNFLLVQRVLEPHGYVVYGAADGIAGIAMAREIKPDLILVDINIPGMDGYEASTKMRGMEELRGVPIVALTANVSAGDRERSLACGCTGYLGKPIDIEKFPRQLREFLTGKTEQIPDQEEVHYLREYSSRLVNRLEEKIAELTALNRDLESRVEERSRQLEGLQEQLVQSAKLAAVGRLAASVAHEINNPLQAMENFLGVLWREIPPEHPHREYVGLLQESVERISRIVRQLLEMHRAKPSLDQEVDIGEVVEKTLAFLKNQLETRRGDKTVSIFFKDNGSGIEPGIVKHIFEPFFTTKKEGHGTGLGLSVSYGIVKAHGGTIQVESVAGEGATFGVVFPLPGWGDSAIAGLDSGEG